MSSPQLKLVSVVFADVVGSTAFGSDNDRTPISPGRARPFTKKRLDSAAASEARDYSITVEPGLAGQLPMLLSTARR